MALYTGRDIFIRVLNAQGVEDIFYNPGLDVVPFLSAAARFKARGQPAPRPVMCLDEFAALNAAHGHYLISGKPQVVLVHAELGTQQVGGAIQQAWYGKVPVIICAADMSRPGRLNWRAEPFDPGTMLRNCVKWDHRVSEKENFQAVLQEAFQRALSEPCGPVYLSYPLDIISRKAEMSPLTAASAGDWAAVDEGLLAQAAALLQNAVNPLIMTGYCGRNPMAVSYLVDLAETLGAMVVTAPMRMNFPSEHPLCASLEPTVDRPYFLSADVLLAIDYDIPYASPDIRPKDETRFIHIDNDFVKQGERLWDRRPDVAIQGNSAEIIPRLTALLRAGLSAGQRIEIQRRAERIGAENQHRRKNWQEEGRLYAARKPISAEWLAYCINRVVDSDTIIVNQTITTSDSVLRQIPRSKPGTLVGCAGGTIGWALGAALGAKIAAPEKLVVALMGDGAFIYGGPVATLWPSASYQAPFLCVIFNNRAYGAIKMLFRGEWKEGIENSLINPAPEFFQIASACGAYGQVVKSPEDVLPILQEAVAKVKSGQAAVVDVHID